MRFRTLLLILLLTACNLQQQTTPTPVATALPAQVSPTPESVQPTTPLPTLQPTPTQILLVTTTPDLNPTTVDFANGGTPVPGQPTRDAAGFDERYEVVTRDESTITVIFDVTVDSGAIIMIMQGPDGLVWEKTFTTTEAGREAVAITAGGTYEILVDRQNLSGNYAVSWE